MPNANTFEERARLVKKSVEEFKGNIPNFNVSDDQKKNIASLRKNVLGDMKAAVQQLDSLRVGSVNKAPLDMSFATYAQEIWGFAPDETTGAAESFFRAMGINYNTATIDFLLTQGDQNESYRWLVPEIIREALRLGLRKPNFYSNVLAAEENVAQPKITMPFINMSDAMPSKLGEAETIPTGSLSFGSRDVRLQKLGVGLKITDEVRQYTALNLLAIYLQDMGVKLNLGLDIMAIDVLINGDGNGNAAPVIGVYNTSNKITYKDLLRAWIRMGLLGRMPDSILSNENVALDVLTLTEFVSTQTLLAGIQPKIIKPRTPLPTVQAYDIHGAFPVDNQLMLINKESALIKFNSDALTLESERIAEKQISGTYATLTTGFANIFRDGRLIIDGSVAYSSAPFPTWMDAGAYQAANAFKS